MYNVGRTTALWAERTSPQSPHPRPHRRFHQEPRAPRHCTMLFALALVAAAPPIKARANPAHRSSSSHPDETWVRPLLPRPPSPRAAVLRGALSGRLGADCSLQGWQHRPAQDDAYDRDGAHARVAHRAHARDRHLDHLPEDCRLRRRFHGGLGHQLEVAVEGRSGRGHPAVFCAARAGRARLHARARAEYAPPPLHRATAPPRHGPTLARVVRGGGSTRTGTHRHAPARTGTHRHAPARTGTHLLAQAHASAARGGAIVTTGVPCRVERACPDGSSARAEGEGVRLVRPAAQTDSLARAAAALARRAQ